MPRKEARTIANDRAIARTHGARLLNRLLAFAELDPNDPDAEKKAMTQAQINAAAIALKRLLPELKSIEVVGDDDHPVVTKIVRQIAHPDPTNSGGVRAAAETEPL